MTEEDKQELEYINKQSKRVGICLAVVITVVFILCLYGFNCAKL